MSFTSDCPKNCVNELGCDSETGTCFACANGFYGSHCYERELLVLLLNNTPSREFRSKKYISYSVSLMSFFKLCKSNAVNDWRHKIFSDLPLRFWINKNKRDDLKTFTKFYIIAY